MSDRAQPSETAHLRGDIADLIASVEALTQGLRLMLETQHTHTEMLKVLLQAAASPEGETELEILLARIVGGLEVQTESLGRLEFGIGRLGRNVEDAVIRGIQLALGDGVDLDGPGSAAPSGKGA